MELSHKKAKPGGGLLSWPYCSYFPCANETVSSLEEKLPKQTLDGSVLSIRRAFWEAAGQLPRLSGRVFWNRGLPFISEAILTPKVLNSPCLSVHLSHWALWLVHDDLMTHNPSPVECLSGFSSSDAINKVFLPILSRHSL